MADDLYRNWGESLAKTLDEIRVELHDLNICLVNLEMAVKGIDQTLERHPVTKTGDFGPR